jgi:hypothetical protein
MKTKEPQWLQILKEELKKKQKQNGVDVYG